MLCVYSPTKTFEQKTVFSDIMQLLLHGESPAPFSVYEHVSIERACFWLLLLKAVGKICVDKEVLSKKNSILLPKKVSSYLGLQWNLYECKESVPGA